MVENMHCGAGTLSRGWSFDGWGGSSRSRSSVPAGQTIDGNCHHLNLDPPAQLQNISCLNSYLRFVGFCFGYWWGGQSICLEGAQYPIWLWHDWQFAKTRKKHHGGPCLLSDASCGLIRVRKISFLHPACTAPTCWLTGQCPSVQPTGEKGEKPDQAESGSQTHFQERQGWAWKGTWLTMEPSWWVGNSRKFLS